MAQAKETITIRPCKQVIDYFIKNYVDGKSYAVNACLDRYFYLSIVALREIELSENEWMAIYAAANGTIFEPHTIPLFWASIEDADKYEGLGAKWGIDAQNLAKKLRSADLATQFAVVEKAEHWWRNEAREGE